MIEPNDEGLRTLAAAAEREEVIKRSRFLARAHPCDDEAAAMASLDALSHPDCRHNCWAFRVGDVYRCHDAGEPAGTAGRPMLQAIEQQGFDRVAVVVSRWFGGIKLGTGGLVRAYGGITARCLQQASSRPIVNHTSIRLHVPFDAIDVTLRLAGKYGAAVLRQAYDCNGLNLTLQIPAGRMRGFRAAVVDATGGRSRLAAGA